MERGCALLGIRGNGLNRVHEKSRTSLGKSGFWVKGSAATYSRASYTCTTIGNAVFDGRVRDGIGSGHRFMATVKVVKENVSGSLKTAYVGA